MSSLADLPELVGFFSYSRDDDIGSHGALSALRERIQHELRAQLGRSFKSFRLWQDKEAIPSGTLWETEIKNAVAQSVFFIPIITPTVVASPYCRFELDSFLAREAALGRSDLVFPILYIDVPALEDGVRRQNDPVLSLIAKRQYVDWREFRYLDINSTDVKKTVGRFCTDIRDALHRPWLSPEERKAQEEAATLRRAEAERQRLEREAVAKREADERTREAAPRDEPTLLNEKQPPEAVLRVYVLSIAGSVSRIGNGYRFHIRVEADNESNCPTGVSGVTINVPTIDSRERYEATEIQMSSLGCDAPFRHGPGEVIYGFRADGSFGEKAATCLLMESTREQWPPHERIALEADLFASCTRLDLHVRVWSTRPESETGGGFGDPDWNSTKQKDQQGIPAYPLSLGFDVGSLGEATIAVEVVSPGRNEIRHEWFLDHPDGPEMVVVPAGSFTMGSPASEEGHEDNEGPQHLLTIAKPFAVGRHAVTRGQFAAFVNDTNYKTEGGANVWTGTGTEWKLDPNGSWRNPGFRQDDSHPVVCINWNDACAYAAWLSKATG